MNYLNDDVFISTYVQETFTDWPDDESNAIILFFVGCEHHCVNCHNSCLSKIPESEIDYWWYEFEHSNGYKDCYDFFKQQFKSRKFVRISSIEIFERLIIELCEKYNTNKIIFQGGDPLYKHNKDVVKLILERFRSKYNDKYKFCIYTGYKIEKVKEILDIYPDFIKCGTFEQDLYQNPGKDKEKLVFASTNQELYDIKLNKLSNKGIYYFNKTLKRKEEFTMSEVTEKATINDGIVMENEMKNAFEPTAKTARTLGNIKHVVERTLKQKYGINDANITETLLKIHGLNTKQFDFVSCVENDLNEDVLNDASIDPNANKCEKTIESLMVEASNPAKKAIGYDMLYRQMKNDYGKEEAKRLSGEMYSFALALADATKILSCYCYSIDASILVKKGRDFGQLHSKPCKRLCSYISSLCETIHQMSNHLAGAIAVGTFFMDCAHVLMFTDNNGEGYTLEQIKTDKELRKMIENEYQQFVHSVNHLSRNASESPFSNISIFDRPKLKTLLSGEGMPEYFEGKDIDFVIDYIMELQKIFVEFFDKGDVLSEGMPYRFPVVTCNFSKDEKEAEVLDEEFLDYMVEKDIYRYNIFTSTGTKVASCCFRGDTPVLVRSSQRREYLTTFKELYETPLTDNNKIFQSGFWKEYEKISVPYTKDWVKIATSNNKENYYTEDHLIPTLRGDIPAAELRDDDYILFNTKAAEPVQRHEDGSEDMGIFIGAFLGDGSYLSSDGKLRGLVFSFNKHKAKILYPHINTAVNDFCAKIKEETGKELTIEIHERREKKLFSLIINSTDFAEYFEKKYVPHNHAENKYFNESLFGYSTCFRYGLVKGMMYTDGGNNNRYYTTSDRLVSQLEALYTTLGIPSIINEDKRLGLVEINGEIYTKNFTVKCVRGYMNSPRSRDLNYCWRNGQIYFKIKNISRVENKEGVAYCVRMKDQSNPYFTLPNGVITHNCRLINDVDLMKDFGSQSNSFGGVGISLGSHRVVTINFNRIALEANTYKEYKEILVQRIEDAAKILASHKRLLVHLTEKGYQLFIKNGWIRMDRLFSTFGVLGLVEVENTIKSKGGFKDLSNDIDIIGESLKILDQKMFEVSEKYGIMGNIEQIPGESMAIRLSKADKLLYGDQKVPYKLYANQFVPLWKKASLWEKLSADGKYNKMITGGGIVHAQIGERVTPTQAKKIIKYAIKSGCEHFALNAVYTKCNNGHTSFGNHSVCPHCGSQFLKHYTRVVGFFTEVENWAPERRIWEFPNRTYVDVNNIGNPESSEEIAKDTPETNEEPVCETCRIDAVTTNSSDKSKEPRKRKEVKDESELNLTDFNTPNPDFVFFYRSHCPKCHDFVVNHFEEIKSAGKTITCIRVDDNDKENIALATKHGVKSTPTLVYNKEGTFENSVSTQIAKKHVLGDTENEQMFTIEEVLKMGLEK